MPYFQCMICPRVRPDPNNPGCPQRTECGFITNRWREIDQETGRAIYNAELRELAKARNNRRASYIIIPIFTIVIACIAYTYLPEVRDPINRLIDFVKDIIDFFKRGLG